MNKTIKLAILVVAIAITGTSCKKNWTCIHSYSANPFDPNASMVHARSSITAKTKKQAKLECKSLAGPNDTWELEAR